MAAKNDQESIERTIKALLARAQHPNTPKPEADLCMERAQKMMIKHSLNQANLESEMGAQYKTRPATFELYIPSPFVKQKSELLTAIADIFNCKVVRNNFVDEDGFALATVFGFESDTNSVWTLFQSIHAQMVDALYDQPGSSAAFRRSFISSFTSRVYSRLMDYYAEELEEAAPGTELVLASRKEEIMNLRDEMFPSLRTTPQTKVTDIDGLVNGREAGNKADITLNSRKIGEDSREMIEA